MILYHGSYTIVKSPNLEHSRPNLDFGLGFYVTPIKEQAEKWSLRYSKTGKKSIVSTYNFDECHAENLKILKFDTYSEEWLNFIINCRSGKDKTDFDIVVGGIANDKVFNTIELFFDDLIDKAEAIKRLRFEKPNEQMCFRTYKSLSYLEFAGSEELC